MNVNGIDGNESNEKIFEKKKKHLSPYRFFGKFGDMKHSERTKDEK